MTTSINRHNLATYLTFYFEEWPRMEKAVSQKLRELIQGDEEVTDLEVTEN